MPNNLSKALSCGHCSNISHMKIIGNVSRPDERISLLIQGPEDGTTYSVLECPACKRENIISYYYHEFMDSEDDITYELLYPIDKNLPVGLPKEILSTLEAAEKVKTINVNAYVILLRRLLELVCLDRKAKSGTLASMLSELAKRGEIPEKLVLVAQGVKNFGNIGAHAGLGELSQLEIPIVKALVTAILEYIYSAPHLASMAEAKLNEIKLKAKS